VKQEKQPTLERPVCVSPCVLLLGHSGPHISSQGKSWYAKRNVKEGAL